MTQNADAKASVLVVDDESSIVMLITQHLEAEGLKCVGFSSSVAALADLEKNEYDLVITDLSMPDKHGMDIVSFVKKHTPDTAIIVVTAYAEVKSAVQALRFGADDYILKPFNLIELGLSASRAIEKRNLIIDNRMYQQQLEAKVQAAVKDLELTNRELLSTKDYLENLLHSTMDGIVTLNAKGNITFANRGAVRMLGYELEELVGASVEAFCIGHHEEVAHVRMMLEHSKMLQGYQTEVKMKDETLLPVSVSLSYVHDSDGGIAATLAIFKDVSEQRRLEQELKEMSIKDMLSGLYNQRHFYDRLAVEIERARRQKHPLSLLLFDVDQFKTYNDCHGHLAGDKVLQTIGQVVLENTREHVDLGFRYGGDEFTIILPEASEASALAIAERIRRGFEGKHFDMLTLSVGLMAYKEGYSEHTFIRFTDAMMYGAKRSGGNRVFVYRPDAAGAPQPDPTIDNIEINQPGGDEK
jgi:diguanylate cyclase (GGDEF)-like protein/PAS domain S-box-containing protein